MTIGKKEFAERKALELFDRWNDVTGIFTIDTGYYYEITALIKDAVDIGARAALDIEVDINQYEDT